MIEFRVEMTEEMATEMHNLGEKHGGQGVALQKALRLLAVATEAEEQGKEVCLVTRAPTAPGSLPTQDIQRIRILK